MGMNNLQACDSGPTPEEILANAIIDERLYENKEALIKAIEELTTEVWNMAGDHFYSIHERDE